MRSYAYRVHTCDLSVERLFVQNEQNKLTINNSFIYLLLLVIRVHVVVGDAEILHIHALVHVPNPQIGLCSVDNTQLCVCAYA